MEAVELHPLFVQQFESMCQNPDSYDVAAEIAAPVDILNDKGHAIEGEDPGDPSHPIVISRFQMFALRRTPPTSATPYATGPPVLRIPYVWFDAPNATEVAVVMMIGDKTALGNRWYPHTVTRIESQLIPSWEHNHPQHRAQLRRTR